MRLIKKSAIKAFPKYSQIMGIQALTLATVDKRGNFVALFYSSAQDNTAREGSL